MLRAILLAAILGSVVACGDETVPQTDPGSGDSASTTSAFAVPAASTSTSLSVASTTAALSTTTPSFQATGRDDESFPVCEPLPTIYTPVEVPLDGSEVEVFDLATAAQVDTFRFRSTVPLPLTGEYGDGIFHYTFTGQSFESEWLLIGAGWNVWVMTSDGWETVDEIAYPPWLHADPSWVYSGSMNALPHMEHVGWEVAEGRDVAVFVGGLAAFAAYWGEDVEEVEAEARELDLPESAATAEIWMTPDCYPFRVDLQMENVEHGAFDWELYDLGAPVMFDLPADIRK